MAAPAAYLIDTNILLRLSRKNDPHNELAQQAFERLGAAGAVLHFSLQTVAEFWNVCTRPVERNGYGLPIGDTLRRVSAIERTMTLLADSAEVYVIWRQLVMAHGVRGV